MGKAGTTLPRARGICLVLTHLRRYSAFPQTGVFGWLRGVDLNHRPLGYEPNELPDCSTPHEENNTARLKPVQPEDSPRRDAGALLRSAGAAYNHCRISTKSDEPSNAERHFVGCLPAPPRP